jgi:DNA-directed RNA polymerase subunit RPC12/RpoP
MQSHTITTRVPTWIDDDRYSRRLWRKLSCVLFGHKVNNAVFITMRGREKQCRCGAHYLRTWMETRVSHTVSCFLRGHHYEQIAVRSGHNEYVCVQCGHPLLFRAESDPYANRTKFTKKVRYLCNLFGHSVHLVTSRQGFHEYACDCGHSFLKKEAGRNEVKHPPVCLFAGHFLHFTERRGDYDEYLCRNCGHTFYFIATT